MDSGDTAFVLMSAALVLYQRYVITSEPQVLVPHQCVLGDRATVQLAGVMDREDVGMVERGCELRFALEAPPGRSVA